MFRIACLFFFSSKIDFFYAKTDLCSFSICRFFLLLLSVLYHIKVIYSFDYIFSLSQAISTGYFISASLINPDNTENLNSSKLLIKYNWIFCILFTCFNWMMFRNSFWVLGEAADRMCTVHLYSTAILYRITCYYVFGIVILFQMAISKICS